MFPASIVVEADWICGHKVVSACDDGNAQTLLWTILTEEQFYLAFLALEAGERYQQAKQNIITKLLPIQ